MASCDQSFGPRVSSACRSFDFTLLFEDIVLATVPAAALLFLLPAPLYLLLRTGSRVKTSTLGTVKLVSQLPLVPGPSP
jgi:ATP-binding cassette, subfamily C (CFTR/MRP), member 1